MKIDTTDLWSKKDVQRFAKIYTARLEEKQTPTRLQKATFFNYVIDHWDVLQNNGTVRIVPAEAKIWYKNREDYIFSNEAILNPEQKEA